jgi:hypothetical protein
MILLSSQVEPKESGGQVSWLAALLYRLPGLRQWLFIGPDSPEFRDQKPEFRTAGRPAF